MQKKPMSLIEVQGSPTRKQRANRTSSTCADLRNTGAHPEATRRPH